MLCRRRPGWTPFLSHWFGVFLLLCKAQCPTCPRRQPISFLIRRSLCPVKMVRCPMVCPCLKLLKTAVSSPRTSLLVLCILSRFKWASAFITPNPLSRCQVGSFQCDGNEPRTCALVSTSGSKCPQPSLQDSHSAVGTRRPEVPGSVICKC